MSESELDFQPFEPTETISQGTLRSVDLVQSFYNAIHSHNIRGESAIDGNIREIAQIVISTDDGEAARRLVAANLISSYDDALEFMSWLVGEMARILDEHAPDGCHFGSHEGDGAHYGFWPNKMDDDGSFDSDEGPMFHQSADGYGWF